MFSYCLTLAIVIGVLGSLDANLNPLVKNLFICWAVFMVGNLYANSTVHPD